MTKIESLPYKEVMYWPNRIKKLKGTLTKKVWCDIGNELRIKHGLSEKVTVCLLHGDIEEAIKLEKEELKNQKEEGK